MQTKEQIFEQCYKDLPKTDNEGDWLKFEELGSETSNIVYTAMELYASQQQGGMRWVDCATQLPDTYDMHEKHFRLDGKKVYGILIEAANGGVLFEYKVGNGYCTLEDLSRVQWLDESEASPTSQPAQVNKKLISDCIACITDASNRLNVDDNKNDDFFEQSYYLLEQLREVESLVVEPSPEPVAAQGVEEAAKERYPDFIFDGKMGPASRLREQTKVEMKREAFKAGASFIQSQHPSPAKHAVEFAEWFYPFKKDVLEKAALISKDEYKKLIKEPISFWYKLWPGSVK